MSVDRPQIHKLADVQSPNIGKGTRVWQFVVVLPSARIGENCNICSSCFIENDVVVGNNVTVKNGVSLYDGVRLEDDVFIGPNVTFTNDPLPRSGKRPSQFVKTVVKRGASIGANATLLPGVTIGEGAMVGAGSVVSRDVPPFTMVLGNPARVRAPVAPDVRAEAPPRVDAHSALPIRGAEIWKLRALRESRGELTFADFSELPFVPKRYFAIHGVRASTYRGNHAHRTCAQFFIPLSGSCRIILDDTKRRYEVELSSPSWGLLVNPGIWCVLHSFTEYASILVLASEPYDSKEYIRDYGAFRAYKAIND